MYFLNLMTKFKIIIYFKYETMSKKRFISILTIGFVFLLIFEVNAQSRISFDKYHTYQEVKSALKALNQANPTTTMLHKIAVSPGGKDILILEVGKQLKNVPAVFVGANFEGITPIASEGALYLANLLLSNESADKKWYIMPLPNPDASENFFSKTVYQRSANNMSVNNDNDDQSDEDGFDDLNKDGFITKMRVKNPQGTFQVSPKDDRILVKADKNKGERGIYKIYSEGIDNDKDGKYNEDGPGGVNVGLNFPHLFNTYKKESGLYPGSTPEVYALMKFIYERPEIAMVHTIGTADFCLAAPKGGRKGGVNMKSIKMPRRFASMVGAEAGKTYSMDEIIELVKPIVPPGMEVTNSMIAGFMGLGAAVNPLADDLKFYNKFAKDYKSYLKDNKFNTERLPATPAKDGSFELWAYYHLGLPSFSMNLFTIPLVKEKKEKGKGLSLSDAEKMSSEDFIALGEEKIKIFLENNNAPKNFNANKIVEMMEGGKISPKQMVGMMKNMPKKTEEGLSKKDKALLAYVDKNPELNGFVPWETYTHPSLGEVEIGGFKPFLENTPKPELIDSLCKVQIPWLVKLAGNLPKFKFLDEKITELGTGIYKLELFIENQGYLPYPIAMGKRNSQPAPVIVSLSADNIEILEGKKRMPITGIGGKQVSKLTWIIKVKAKENLTLKLESKSVGSDVKQIKIGG